MDRVPDLRTVKSFHGFARFVLRQLLATALFQIWGTLCLFMLWAIIIASLYEFASPTFAINNSLLGVLGTLISFAVSLRASSGYERHTEGRRLWGTLQLALRNMATLIWIHLENPVVEGQSAEEKDEDDLRLMLEKRSALNLITAYPYAVKHALRHETGPFYEDLFPLICTLPKYSRLATDDAALKASLKQWQTSSHVTIDSMKQLSPITPSLDATSPPIVVTPSPMLGVSQNGGDQAEGYMTAKSKPGTMPPLAPGFAPPVKTLYDHVPVLYIIRPFIHTVLKIRRSEDAAEHELNQMRKDRAVLDSNIVIDISLSLSSYIKSVSRRHLVDGPYMGELLAAQAQINDCFAHLERILTSPLPYTFHIHLTLVVYIYLILLPFQIVATFGYLSVLFIAVTAFFFQGFLYVGSAVENPFGYADGDLNLDLFCAITAAEIAEVTAHPPHDLIDMLEHPRNQPLATTGDLRSAKDIIGQHDYRERAAIRKELHKSHLNELRRRVGMVNRFGKKPHGRPEVYPGALEGVAPEDAPVAGSKTV